MAGLLLAFVLALERGARRLGAGDQRRRFLLTLPAGLIVAGAIYAYSYLGIAWFAATLVHLVGGGGGVRAPPGARADLRRQRAGRRAVGRRVPAAGRRRPDPDRLRHQHVLLRPSASRRRPADRSPPAPSGTCSIPCRSSRRSGSGSAPISAALPANPLHAGELGSAGRLSPSLSGSCARFAAASSCWPSGVVAAGLIWAYSQHSQSPYVAAKALVIGSPLAMGCALRELLPRWRGPRSSRALALACAAALCIAAGYSSYQALRSEPVQAPEAGRELAGVSPHHRRRPRPVPGRG